MTKSTDLISEYEAASITCMSPDLLRWFTSHAPKSGIKRKLKAGRKDGDRIFYDREEVLSFDAWLKQPWPRKDGKRPRIPSKIRAEIKVEANGACAICHGHKDTCEAAHLDPVAKSDNNHPENLLWLCSNHHTAYDAGLFGPNEDEADFVASFKAVLRRYKIMQWRMQAELSVKAIAILENCDLLKKQLEIAKTKAQVEAVEAVAEKIFATIPTIAPVSKADPRYQSFRSVSDDLKALSKSKKPLAERLRRASRVRQKFVAALGMVACPLCEASGKYDGNDCPICQGDREIEERDASRVDLSQYAKVDCPLCRGSGKHDGDDCPICGGEGGMERRHADWVDIRDYQKVECPVCSGTGVLRGDPCRACGGEGDMDRRHADQLDVASFDIVECPVCEGSGRHDHSDCPACGGEGELEKSSADEIDIADYRQVKCPVCKGNGRLRGNDCPACNGERRFDGRYLDHIDVRDYDLVSCPVCKDDPNRRDECRACGGEGEMERRHARDTDPRDYR
ncbi:HNH endonuclease signature motif containing protein [Sphingobium fuliginis]|nr:HNH endonuclease signature motif containing protein [Sphingobium fuliginis]